MATKYSDIYNRAMFRFTDYGFLDVYEDRRDEIMRNFLKAAQVEFANSCTEINDYNDENEEFNSDLSDEVQEILALGVAYQWLSQKTLNSELLRNSMIRKDYNTYSPANLWKEMRTLRDDIYKEYRGKINEYSFRHGSIDKLKVGSN